MLYLNRSTPGKIRFEETGMESGVALDGAGIPNGGMGTAIGDPFLTGRAAIWVTNYENELHGLYENLGKGLFLYSTPKSGIAALGQSFVGFGTAFLDLENRGWDDLVITVKVATHRPHHDVNWD